MKLLLDTHGADRKYGIIVPQDSKLREPIDRALLHIIHPPD